MSSALLNYTANGELPSEISMVAVPAVATLTPAFDAPQKCYQTGTQFYAKEEQLLYILDRDDTQSPTSDRIIAASVGNWLLVSRPPVT